MFVNKALNKHCLFAYIDLLLVVFNELYIELINYEWISSPRSAMQMGRKKLW